MRSANENNIIEEARAFNSRQPVRDLVTLAQNRKTNLTKNSNRINSLRGWTNAKRIASKIVAGAS
jgi:hypothetical protein